MKNSYLLQSVIGLKCVQPPFFMKCETYCTASSYDITGLRRDLASSYKTTLYKDVLHVEVPHPSYMAHVFFFPYGVTVCWGLSEAEVISFLEKTLPVSDEPLDTPEEDEYIFTIGDQAKISKNEIFLPAADTLSLIALSHGLAQSVKLEAFESTVQKTYNNSKHIPIALSKAGGIPLSRREIRRMMGQLFLERNSINLQWDVLDTPEFFWQNLQLEPLYTMVSSHLDIENRVKVLNQRLEIVHELFEMLGNEVNHQHSSRLEWTIIILIVVEVVIMLTKDVFKVL